MLCNHLIDVCFIIQIINKGAMRRRYHDQINIVYLLLSVLSLGASLVCPSTTNTINMSKKIPVEQFTKLCRNLAQFLCINLCFGIYQVYLQILSSNNVTYMLFQRQIDIKIYLKSAAGGIFYNMTFKIGKIGLTECLSGESEPSKYAYFKVHYA